MFRKWGVYVLLICLAVFLVSCATIATGRYQTVSFNSEPSGATVIVGGRTLGKTPLTIPLERKGEQAMIFEKEGYESVTMPLTTSINGWFWGNILTGGLLGSTTDGVSGAINKYSPSAYHVTLKPKGSAFFTPKGQIKVFILSNYLNIAKEANSSSREYLPALFSLLKIPENEQKAAMQNIKDLVNSSDNSLVFAEKVIDNYFKD